MRRTHHLRLLLAVAALGCSHRSGHGPPPPAAPEVSNLSGQNAFLYMRRDSTRTFLPDSSALKTALTDESSVIGMHASADPDEIALLKKDIRPRRNLRPEGFQKFDFTQLAGASQSQVGGTAEKDAEASVIDPDLSQLQDEVVIARVFETPVKNQGERGTCAAQAGTGAMEYALLKNPLQKPVIFSPQRFYFLSKPECQTNGCDPRMFGSNTARGYLISNADPNLNIPTEDDCPYNPKLAANDLQVPQAAGCSSGATRAKTITAVAADANAIARMLEQGFAVPINSTLSQNWEQGGNLITLKDSGFTGQTDHARGHAFLFVGYKKLPNMPEEGGMCFYIKNSWGPGWGINGYSCQTWQWWKKFGAFFGYVTAVPTEVDLRSDLAAGGAAPTPNLQEEDRLPPELDRTVYDDSTVNQATGSSVQNPGNVVVPDAPAPSPGLGGLLTPPTFHPAALLGPGDNFYRGEYTINGNTLSFRGVVRGQGKKTGLLDVTLNGGLLQQEQEDVGRIDTQTGDMTLCTGEFDAICAVRFDPTANRLFIEFLYTEERDFAGSEVPSGTFVPFLEGEGFTIERLEPTGGLTDVAFLRLNQGGQSGQAIRLELSGSDLRFQDFPVGSLDPPALCSGDFGDFCGLFIESSDLEIVPNWS